MLTEADPRQAGFRYGLLLPHFGAQADGERLLAAARQAEALGFDSLWVRDHVVYQPHRYEDQGPAFFEPMSVLAAVGVATSRVMLGTAAIIPHRHPIYLAQQLATISHLVGPSRLIFGFGVGRVGVGELESLGLGGVAGPELHRECCDIVRGLWKGERLDHQGTAYSFEAVRQQPKPLGSIPIWYCGNSPAAARRAAAYCDGWIPSRLPLATFARRVGVIQELAEAAGRPRIVLGATPITSPARSLEAGLARVNLEGLLRMAEADRYFVKPKSGRFECADDIDGALLAGPAEQIVEGVLRLQAAGATHISFDLRYRFADWDECVELIGSEVLPRLPRG